MPIIKEDNYISTYQRFANDYDIHKMSGRGDNKLQTNYLNNEIVKSMKFTSDNVVIDIG